MQISSGTLHCDKVQLGDDTQQQWTNVTPFWFVDSVSSIAVSVNSLLADWFKGWPKLKLIGYFLLWTTLVVWKTIVHQCNLKTPDFNSVNQWFLKYKRELPLISLAYKDSSLCPILLSDVISPALRNSLKCHLELEKFSLFSTGNTSLRTLLFLPNEYVIF